MQRVAIHSAPRSGSTWLGEIFNSHPNVNYNFQPLFSYAFKDFLDENSSSEKIDDFFSALETTNDDFVKQNEKVNSGKIPNFSKENTTHIVYKEVRYHHILENLLKKNSEVKIIGLVRNPYAVISSWLKAPKEFRPELGWKPEEEWRFAEKKNNGKKEEFNGYEKWKEVFFLFQNLEKKYPENFTICYYDHLLENTLAEVERLFNFANLKMKVQTLDFIQKSTENHDQDEYSVFKTKSKDDSWKKDLDLEIKKEIEKDLNENKITIF